MKTLIEKLWKDMYGGLKCLGGHTLAAFNDDTIRPIPKIEHNFMWSEEEALSAKTKLVSGGTVPCPICESDLVWTFPTGFSEENDNKIEEFIGRLAKNEGEDKT